MCKVSVIIPTYNRAYCIERSVNSVLSQTFHDFELIIVDDGSSDNTKEVVEAIGDPRIRYVLKENGGAADARNRGIDEAKGDYIAFQDSDDIWHEDKLERQMALMEADETIDFSYHSLRYTIPDVGTIIMPTDEVPVNERSGDIYKWLLHENLVDCPTLFAKTGIIKKCGYFDTDLKALEDYDYALRLAKMGAKAGFVNKVLIEKEMTAGSVSLNPKNYLMASCLIVGKYLDDYISSGNFDYRVTRIFEDAKNAGMEKPIMEFLEKVIKLKKAGDAENE